MSLLSLVSLPGARAERGARPLVRKAITTVAIGVLAGLAAGCGTVTVSGTGSGAASSASAPAASPSSPSAVPTITATGSPVQPGQVQCANWPSGAPTGTLPASFTPVTVERCVTGSVHVPGKGLFLAGTLEQAGGNLVPLVTALRHPSQPRPTGQMCPQLAMLPLHLVLVAKDGSKFIPTIPVNGCGLDQEQVLSALAALSWQTVSIRLYSQVSGTQPQPVTPTRGAGMNGSPAVS